MFEFFAGKPVVLSGNCADFQGGCALGFNAEQGIRAFAKPNGSDFVKIESEDFGNFEIEIGDTEPKAEEAESFSALVRGIMNGFIESGNIFGGFDAKIVSEIPLEEAFAPFEILIGKIISGLFFENSVPPTRLAQFGSAAENDYYGRPSGISKQLISALGGTVFMDFSEPEMPQFRKIAFDFEKSGFSAAIISEKNVFDPIFEETEILKDLALLSWNMGHNFLSEADEAEFIAQFPILRQKCGERAVFNALRYFSESRNAFDEAEALENGDFSEFLRIFKESGESSEEKSGVLSFVQNLLSEKGAAKESSGKVLAFVPEEKAAEFAEGTEKQGFDVVFLA